MTTPTTAPALKLKISTDYTNSLDGIVLYEPFNDDAFQKLVRSNLLRDTFSCEFTEMRHDNEQSMLRDYYANRTEIDGRQYVAVQYKKPANNPLGRSNPVQALGLFNIRREIRQTLVKGLMVDIDIVNAHPVMLHQILLAVKIPHPVLTSYIADRETLLTGMMSYYDISRETAKKIVIAYLYGGAFAGRKKDGLINIEATECGFLAGLYAEIKHIHKTLARHNPDVVAITERIKEGDKAANVKGSACSYILQEYESRVLEVAYKYCVEREIVRNGVVALCADGLMVEADRFYESLPAEISAVVLAATGFDLTFIQKPMEDDYCAVLDAHVIIPLTEPIPAPPAVQRVCDEIAAAEDAPPQCVADKLKAAAFDDVQTGIAFKKNTMHKTKEELEDAQREVAHNEDLLAAMTETINTCNETIPVKEAGTVALKIELVNLTAAIRAADPGSEARKSLIAAGDANRVATIQIKEEIRVNNKLLRDTETAYAKLLKKNTALKLKVPVILATFEKLRDEHAAACAATDAAVNKRFKELLAEHKKAVAKEEGDADDNGVWSDREAAMLVYELYPHFRCCNKILFVFDDETGLWSDNSYAVSSIIARYDDKLYKLKMNKKGEVEATMTSYGSNTRMKRDMIQELMTLCINDAWVELSKSSGIGKILFTNGYYDYTAQKFYDKIKHGFNPDIVFFANIPHAFERFRDDDIQYMDDIRTRLFHTALGTEVGDYLLLNFARGLAGDSAVSLKRILFVLGETNCGKTILTMALAASCGKYVESFNAESLAFKKMDSGDSAQSMRWAMLVANARILVSSELNSDVVLNSNIIKRISSGGDMLKGRLHGGNETSFRTHFLPVMFANDMVKIKPYDKGLDDRARFIQFDKSFVEEPTNEFELKMDPDIKQEIATARFQRCFVGLLIRAYTDYADAGKREVEPGGVVVAKELYVGTERSSVVERFLADYEITGDPADIVLSSVIADWIKKADLGISMTSFGLQMNKYAKVKGLEVCSKVKKIGGKARQCWFGIRPVIEFYEEG